MTGRIVAFLALALVGLIPFLGAAAPFGWLGVDALLADHPLLTVALGDATSNTMEISLEARGKAIGSPEVMHASVSRSVVADGSRARLVVLLKRWVHWSSHAGALVGVLALGLANLLARWPLFAAAVVSSDRTGNLGFHWAVHGRQLLAAFMDNTVALDEHVGFDVSSVCDLASASGYRNSAGWIVMNLHASVIATDVVSLALFASHGLLGAF
jgi:hypothetical protein